MLFCIHNIGVQNPEDDCYGPINESDEKLAFFPNHPVYRRKANYNVDKNDKLSTSCRKFSKTHSTLNPGLFTLFCPHGVCLGFQLMFKAESPRIPFEIFVQRFKDIPTDIVYDNACKLYLYSMKREPLKFQNTRFMVDRLHYPNHVGCSLGYSMDSFRR